MAKSPKITVAVANAMLDAGIGTVANSGKLRLYTGSQPTKPEDAPGGTLLAEFTMNVDAFPAAANGTLTANTIGPVYAVADGVAAWCRLLTSGGTALYDGSVGETSDFDCQIDDVDVVTNDVMAITGFTIGEPVA